MSEENVETARRWLEAISGGTEDFDRALALVHRDIVFVPPGDQPPYRGAERLRRWMEPDAFDEQVVKTLKPLLSQTERSWGDSSSGPEGRPAESSWMSSPGPFGALTRTV